MIVQPALGQKAATDLEENAAQDKAPAKGPLTGRALSKTKDEDKSSDKKAPGAFRTISEVADELDVQQHVLRFWETKFSQIRPLKRGGGRRYYRPEDLALLKRIHHLLYTEGYTIKGVQKLLREKGKAALMQEVQPEPGNSNEPKAQAAAPAVPSAQAPQAASAGMSSAQRSALETMLSELKELRKLVKPE